VHRRLEDLEASLNSGRTATEAMILGSAELPPAELPPVPAQEAAPAMQRPMQDDVIPVRPQPERKRRGIFGWGKREEPRVEPAPRVQPAAPHSARPSAPQPRAMAQAEPLRGAPQPAAPQASDLFDGQKSGDQFEIPAFLRKQTN
jgi:hypothetical protein